MKRLMILRSAVSLLVAGALAGRANMANAATTLRSGSVVTSQTARNMLTLESSASMRAFLGLNALTNLSLVTLSARGITNGLSQIYNDGADFGPDTPGTRTTGVKEAINAVAVSPARDAHGPGGGKLYLGPGIYWLQDTLVTPDNTNAYSLDIEGSGLNACGFVDVSGSLADTFQVGHSNSYTLLTFSMRDMFIASATNATKNVLHLLGPDTGGAGLLLGGIGHADIHHCWFGNWQTMTNTYFTPSIGYQSGITKNNLVLLNVDCNYDDLIQITQCGFQYGMVSMAADHLTFEDNMFEHCGMGQFTTGNDWPNTSIYKVGAAITMTEAYPNTSNYGWVSGTVNENKAWRLAGSKFIDCNVPYFCNDIRMRDHFSYEDDYEGAAQPAVGITGGGHWTFINPRAFNYAGYLVTSGSPTVNYTTWQTTPSVTNFVIVDLYHSGGLTTTNGFVSSNQGFLIHSNALSAIPPLSSGDVYYYSSNGIAYKINVGPTGTRTTNTF